MMLKEHIENWARIIGEQELVDLEDPENFQFEVEEIRDRDRIANLLPSVMSMIVSSYADGYKGNVDIRRLKKTTPLLKIVSKT